MSAVVETNPSMYSAWDLPARFDETRRIDFEGGIMAPSAKRKRQVSGPSTIVMVSDLPPSTVFLLSLIATGTPDSGSATTGKERADAKEAVSSSSLNPSISVTVCTGNGFNASNIEFLRVLNAPLRTSLKCASSRHASRNGVDGRAIRLKNLEKWFWAASVLAERRVLAMLFRCATARMSRAVWTMGASRIWSACLSNW